MVGWNNVECAAPTARDRAGVSRAARGAARQARDVRRTARASDGGDCEMQSSRGQRPGFQVTLQVAPCGSKTGPRDPAYHPVSTANATATRPAPGACNRGCGWCCCIRAAAGTLWDRDARGMQVPQGIGVARLGSTATAHKAAIFARSPCAAWPADAAWALRPPKAYDICSFALLAVGSLIDDS